MERIDYLPHHKDIKIIQDTDMFCINTDTEVLGEFIEVYREDTVLDIGCNNGALLLYASRFSPKNLIGIDINEKAVELARRNMALNNVSAEILVADGNTFTLEEKASVVIFNPPYFKVIKDEKVKNDYLYLAKHEDNFPLESMIECINRNLKEGGTLFFLFETKRMMEVVRLLDSKNIKIKEMKFVYDINKENSNVFMIKGIKNSRDGVKVTKPIIITR